MTSLNTAQSISSQGISGSKATALQTAADKTSIGVIVPVEKVSHTSDNVTATTTAINTQGTSTTSSANSSWNQWDLSKGLSPGSIIGTAASALEIGGETGKRYVPEAIMNEERPNNIGLGTWNAYIESEAAIAALNYGIVTKVAKGAGVATVGVDVGVGIYNNVRAGAPTKKIISDATVDTAFGVGGLAASAEAGALVGSIVPGAGTIAGACVGLGAGVVYVGVTEVFQPWGKSIHDRAKDVIYKLIK